jgi:hypothetical protein
MLVVGTLVPSFRTCPRRFLGIIASLLGHGIMGLSAPLGLPPSFT